MGEAAHAADGARSSDTDASRSPMDSDVAALEAAMLGPFDSGDESGLSLGNSATSGGIVVRSPVDGGTDDSAAPGTDSDELHSVGSSQIDPVDAHVAEEALAIAVATSGDGDWDPSASECPAPPLPPAAPIVVGAAPHPELPHERLPAVAQCVVPGGIVRYYRTTGRLVGECHAHERCFLTRTTRGSLVRGRESQGRPCGLILAWLSECPPNIEQFEHVHAFRPTLEQRIAARHIQAANLAMREVFGDERHQLRGEPPEACDSP